MKYAHALGGMASTLSVRFRPLFGCVRLIVIRLLPGAGNAGVYGVSHFVTVGKHREILTETSISFLLPR
jgi:hypothetical protein